MIYETDPPTVQPPRTPRLGEIIRFQGRAAFVKSPEGVYEDGRADLVCTIDGVRRIFRGIPFGPGGWTYPATVD
jgi:hypothetical protein